MNSPKEWTYIGVSWNEDQTIGIPIFDGPPVAGEAKFKVIEKSAYDSKCAEVERLKADYDDLDYKLGALLCHFTNNRYSYSSYNLEDMKQMIEDVVMENYQKIENKCDSLRAQLEAKEKLLNGAIETIEGIAQGRGTAAVVAEEFLESVKKAEETK